MQLDIKHSTPLTIVLEDSDKNKLQHDVHRQEYVSHTEILRNTERYILLSLFMLILQF